MPPRGKKFQRPLGERPYRKLFIIAVEGVKTEPLYFGIFNDHNSTINVKCLKGTSSSPSRVLKRMKYYIEREGLKKSDAAWLVVDKDCWTDGQLALLYEWSQTEENYGLALSNPKFEYWLLLHFEDGRGVANSRDCSDRLKKHMPNYDKGIDPRKITRVMIEDAIRRARQRDNPPCDKWPLTMGTTVYKLVNKLIGGGC